METNCTFKVPLMEKFISKKNAQVLELERLEVQLQRNFGDFDSRL